MGQLVIEADVHNIEAYVGLVRIVTLGGLLRDSCCYLFYDLLLQVPSRRYDNLYTANERRVVVVSG